MNEQRVYLIECHLKDGYSDLPFYEVWPHPNPADDEMFSRKVVAEFHGANPLCHHLEREWDRDFDNVRVRSAFQNALQGQPPEDYRFPVPPDHASATEQVSKFSESQRAQQYRGTLSVQFDPPTRSAGALMLLVALALAALAWFVGRPALETLRF